MNAHRPEIIDSQGRQIRLGAVLGRGGEGAVYELEPDGDLVAKVYHSTLPPERADKIRIMASLRNDRISKLTAWPVDLLALADSRAPIGLLMPKVMGRKDIHRLYSPKSRRADFQQADWRFLIRAAANTARAFGVVHEAGCIIGDVNHGGVLVAQDATVRLIDCDSFQIVTRTRKFLCEVGVETFTPPELQGKPFKGLVRTDNHDNFGLAVLIFLMLFMGRHPFAGRYLGRGDMPIPTAIRECRFAYGTRRASVQMERPPGTPALSIVGDDIAFLLERAFAPEMIPGGRPSPLDWVESLGRLEKDLKQCSVSPSHWHRREQSCPWCPMEGATGVALFPFVTPVAGAGFNLEALWRQIESIQHPGPPPAIATPVVQPSQAARRVGAANHTRKIAASVVGGIMIAAAVLGGLPGIAPFVLFVGGIAAFFALLNLLDKSQDVRAFSAAENQAAASWRQMEQQWQSKVGPQTFDQKKHQLTDIRRQLGEVANLRLRKLDELKRNQRAIQLADFLDQFEIQQAKISGIGPGRTQTLESYGIETAADLTSAAIAKVPGFGPKMQANLMDWRQSLERKFRFNPNKAIDPRDIARVEQEILVGRQQLEQALRSGFAELKQVSAQILTTRQYLAPQVAAIYSSYLQAVADHKAAKAIR
jgi:DNA-binding helix-hairpin-helix protein with protein kinase domain